MKKPEKKLNRKKRKAKKTLENIPKKMSDGGESCRLCPKAYKIRESLNGHYLHAHFKKEFVKKWIRAKRLSAHSQVRLCSQCGKRFANKEKFITHLGVTHKQVEPFVQAVENEFMAANDAFKSSILH
jgi:hypothetical protein